MVRILPGAGRDNPVLRVVIGGRDVGNGADVGPVPDPPAERIVGEISVSRPGPGIATHAPPPYEGAEGDDSNATSPRKARQAANGPNVRTGHEGILARGAGSEAATCVCAEAPREKLQV